MEQQKPKRIPYGMQNWEALRLEDCYYVDKTHYIPLIEEANHYFFFIRPRRFGKSLLLNMLRQYYDLKKADLFDRLFGDLWIGRNPTPEHNTYLVLNLNFAAFTGVLENYEERFNNYCHTQFETFIDKYKDCLPDNALVKLNQSREAVGQLNSLVGCCSAAGQKIYLFIDEYDHFTNDILASPDLEPQYKSVTHGTGLLRQFFNAIKAGSDTVIHRIFITGVSPVTLDDLTSGFNIGLNYTTQKEFNAMVGFTENEVRQMIGYYRQFYTFNHSTDELIEAMKPWYDNYCFSPKCIGDSPLFNSDMVLYFIFFYVRNGGEFPAAMIDSNIRTDYNKLRMLIRKDEGLEHDASTIMHIVEKGEIASELKDSFPAETITTSDNFVSLLYYFGMLTIAGLKRGQILFRVPNYTVREQLYTYLVDAIKDHHLAADDRQLSTLMGDMAYDGAWRPFFEYITQLLHRFSTNRDRQKGEAYVHGFTLALTCLNKLYLPVSEQDAGPDGGYADIYLQPMLGLYPDMEHSYVVELKYLRSSATDAQLQQAISQARQQLLRYAQAEVISRTHRPTCLHRLVIVWRGMELACAEELAGDEG